MRRRDLLRLLGGLSAWPLALRSQPAGTVAKIGVLTSFNTEPMMGSLREGLRRLGRTEGQNIQFEIRTSQGKLDVLPALAAELVGLKVDVIVAAPTPAVQAAKQATKEIPIVMAAGDPVGTGLIASLARPGGNITGMSATTAEMGGKLLELIRQMRPSAKRVGVLANAPDPFVRPFVETIERGGRVLSVETPTIRVRGAEELKSALAELMRQRVDAVIVQPSLPRKPVIDFSLEHRLLAVSPTSAFPEEGGLLSYSAIGAEVWRECTVYIDKILRGVKPGDLPVQQPTKFELVLNARTAKAIGVPIPAALRTRADRVIE